MPFAHGGEAGGPNFEALILAVPMVVVGIILFVQKSAKPVVSVLLVLGGITLALGGFTFLGTEDDHDAQAAAADPRYATAVAGLCETSDLLSADDIGAALTAFFDESHIVLHDVADRLAERDRAGAAALLESKQAVEAGFEQPEFAVIDKLQRDLDDLIIATVQGLAALDERVPGCN